MDLHRLSSPTRFEYQTASVTRAEVKFSGLATSYRARRSREAKRLLTPVVEPPPAQYWVELTENKCTWEKYVEDTVTIAQLATLIQKRSGGLTSRGQALLEAREQIVAKSMRAGAEAANRSLRQERAALEILTCAWDDCNERATMRCPWCHQVPYCRLEHRDLNFNLHGVDCRARAMYR